MCHGEDFPPHFCGSRLEKSCRAAGVRASTTRRVITPSFFSPPGICPSIQGSAFSSPAFLRDRSRRVRSGSRRPCRVADKAATGDRGRARRLRAASRSPFGRSRSGVARSEEHTSELQSRLHLGCRLLLEKKNKNI